MAGPTPPVFVVAGSAAAQRIRKLLQAGGGAWSTAVLEEFATPAAAQNALQQSAPDTVIVITPQGHVDAAWETWLKELTIVYKHVALVILTDVGETATIARAHGVTAVGPEEGLSPTLLTTFIETALTVQNLRHRQESLQELYDLSDQRFRDMADQFADWLWEVDTNLVLTFSSSRKRPAQSAVAGTPFVQCFLPEEGLRIEDDFAELMRSPGPFHERDYWSADTYGTRFCWSVSGTPVYDNAGRLTGFRGVAHDVSPLKATTDQLYYLVNTDSLTGVVNRNRFYDELARTLRFAKRENRSGLLVVLDLDRFSAVNHVHGYSVGDKLLIHVAQVLKDTVRTGDVVARLDGDQFALLLRDLRPEEVDSRLERLQATIAARPMHTDKTTLSIGYSAGVASYPLDGTDADTLLAHANEALVSAKQHGPNRTERYDASAPAALVYNQLGWMTTLTEALADPDNRLALHYQPIVPISGRLQGEFYETLVRLVQPDGALVPAARFISSAEEFGLINRLDHAVSRRALKALQHYHGIGRPLHLSVNISSKSFQDETFFTELAKLLKESNLPQGAFVIEITETALLRDLPRVKEIMTILKAAGAGFALDDCGVGYSSLNYIRHLELDYIKIDGTFIRNLHTSEEDQAFVKALADVAKQKNIATVAEMVEHEAAVGILHKLGIDFGQGYHFAAPGPELPPQRAKPSRLDTNA